MESSNIRQLFLDFFKEKGHEIKNSSSLIPDDPTLLLTAAGMVQFKPVFEGKKKVDYSRAATCQKCVRTTDIDRVGHTARHLTFFEMLGNFSFGDYFKEGAIELAHEFLVDRLKLDLDKLYVTVFRDDDEAFKIWEEKMKFPKERIVRLGEEDNFWSAGPTGACGPCSEIIFDRGPQYGCGEHDCFVGCDCDRYLEVWNLVFMQYDRDIDGNLAPLPTKNIDTGMGLERISALMQDVDNVFYTDLFGYLMEEIRKLTGIKLGLNEQQDISLKVIADHIRTVAFLTSDGILPANDGRGYILRRLIRRAKRHGHLLGIKDLFLEGLCALVIDNMSPVYPELIENKDLVLKVVHAEETRFDQTLRSGTAILEDLTEKIKAKGEKVLGSDVAFQLYDTYGFPYELTEEIASEQGLTVDRSGFDVLMEEQKEKARAAWSGSGSGHDAIYHGIEEIAGQTEFLGYESFECGAIIKALVKNGAMSKELLEGDEGAVLLDNSVFYAEKGGQVGDTGFITTETGKFKVANAITPVECVTVHLGMVESGVIKFEQKADAKIDASRRRAIARNHTATHILQWALRLVFGPELKQAGSFVADGHFRFDFNHTRGLTKDEIVKVERLVNDKILENQPVRYYTTTIDYARENGVIALFGEKYSEFVRVLEVGNFSKELCGGTHVTRTGDIGMMRILQEGSIGSNIRRIEGITGQAVYDKQIADEQIIKGIGNILKCDQSEVVERLESLLEKQKQQSGEIMRLKDTEIKDRVSGLINNAVMLDGARAIVEKVAESDMDSLRRYADNIRESLKVSYVLTLFGDQGDKAIMLAAVSPDLTGRIKAGGIVKNIAPLIGGGGGGKDELAQAGGKDPSKIEKAIEMTLELIKTEL